MIRIALSTDIRGFHINATLVASVVRRASMPVHVRCWCRGFLPESFEVGILKVEFLPATEEVTGKYPGNSGPAAYDRLLVIRDCPDWDRCMVMDYDQVALCDLAPLFTMDLDDHLLAAHMQGVDMAYAMRVWLKRPLPEGWEQVAEHPYFLMPPLLHLAEMRKSGTWEKFQAAHASFGADEQLSLTAATEGRILPLPSKWNLFPPLHIREDEVPEGIIHWSGWPKPWHPDAKVWRADIWEAERSSWEHLRMGLWEKPVAVEVEPDDDRGVEALLKRGWKVHLLTGGAESPADEVPHLNFPDFTVEAAEVPRLQRLISKAATPVERVRFGAWARPAEWLAGVDPLPEHVVLRGPLDAREIHQVQALGYGESCRLKSSEWTAGGPMSRVLGFERSTGEPGLDATEELHLKRTTGTWLPVFQARTLEDPIESAERQVTEPEKVAVIVAAIGKQRRHLKSFLLTLRRNFLPAHEVHVFLFTDGDYDDERNLTVIRVHSEDHAKAHLSRYRWILEEEARFAAFSHLYLMKVAIRVVDRVDREILSDLVGVLHSGYADLPRGKMRFEANEGSVAWVHPDEGDVYYCGSLQGGKRECFLIAARSMAAGIAEDEARQVSAVWGDESHWNRYLMEELPSIILGPAYAWRTMGESPEFHPVIAVVAHDDPLTGETKSSTRRPLAPRRLRLRPCPDELPP
jgi:histo-blood group ABO system transferase